MASPSRQLLTAPSGLFLLFPFLVPDAALGQPLALTLDAVEHPALSARSVRLRVDAGRQGSAQLQIGELRVAQRRFSRVTVVCAPLRWDGGLLDCPSGRLTAAGQKAPMAVALRFVPAMGNLQLTFLPSPKERWGFALDAEGRERRVRLDVANGDVARMAAWVPTLGALRAKGKLDGTATWRVPGSGRDEIEFDWRVAGGALSDQAGIHAAEKIGASSKLRARRQADQWQWELAFDWFRGEAFLAPWCLPDGGFRAELAGTLGADSLAVAKGEVSLRDVGTLAFDGKFRRPDWRIDFACFQTSAFPLGRAAPLLVAPTLEQSGAPPIDFSGETQLAGEISAGRLVALDASLSGIRLGEARQRFGLSGVTGRLAWRRDAPTEGTVKVASAAFGRLQSGSFDIPFRAEGLRFAVPRLAVPLLDGRVLFEGFEARMTEGRWVWDFAGAVEPISLEQLTTALGLPRMAGTLSASIPSVHYADSTLALDGALVIQVFDGFVSATDLRLVEPLGRVPRLQATLEARHLHLGQLTDIFSFGSISGYVDGYARNLELANWRPQRFDALLITSPGTFRKRISQRAVQNIGALGGAGPVAALQRSFLGLFDEFGYEKLGLSCSLRAGVCDMAGVEPAPGGYVIVKGSGVPSITVIGYNRHVDWDELLARLQRVTSANAAPVVQ